MILYKKFITREFIVANQDKLFIFGDNDLRVGLGGQAKEMRGEINSIGIRVKKAPLTGKNVYYTDKEYISNISKIAEDFKIVDIRLKSGVDVVVPSDGIGTGLARLEEYAPLTLKFIQETITYFAFTYGYKDIK